MKLSVLVTVTLVCLALAIYFFSWAVMSSTNPAPAPPDALRADREAIKGLSGRSEWKDVSGKGVQP